MAKKTVTKKTEQEEAPKIVQQTDVDLAVEKRLIALYTLQCVDAEIDNIRQMRGELPQAIQDLEDEVAGMQTRISNLQAENKNYNSEMSIYDRDIATHKDDIAKYTEHQNNVKNSREFESLQKEIAFKELEITHCEKKKKDLKARIEENKKHIDAAQKLLDQRQAELDEKRNELSGIMEEYQVQEDQLLAKSKEQEGEIDEYYLAAYKRLRKAARNGLAVVPIERDACGGCYSKIPPQRQTEIRMHKKVIVCENCGRILVDDDIVERSK